MLRATAPSLALRLRANPLTLDAIPKPASGLQTADFLLLLPDDGFSLRH